MAGCLGLQLVGQTDDEAASPGSAPGGVQRLVSRTGKPWCECSDEQKSKLWTAITKGGWFTQDNKKKIRQAEQEYKRAIHEGTEEPQTLEADKQQEDL